MEREPLALSLWKLLEAFDHLVRVGRRLMIVDACLAKFTSIRQIANRIAHRHIGAQAFTMCGPWKFNLQIFRVYLP